MTLADGLDTGADGLDTGAVEPLEPGVLVTVTVAVGVGCPDEHAVTVTATASASSAMYLMSSPWWCYGTKEPYGQEGTPACKTGDIVATLGDPQRLQRDLLLPDLSDKGLRRIRVDRRRSRTNWPSAPDDMVGPAAHDPQIPATLIQREQYGQLLVCPVHRPIVQVRQVTGAA